MDDDHIRLVSRMALSGQQASDDDDEVRSPGLLAGLGFRSSLGSGGRGVLARCATARCVGLRLRAAMS